MQLVFCGCFVITPSEITSSFDPKHLTCTIMLLSHALSSSDPGVSVSTAGRCILFHFMVIWVYIRWHWVSVSGPAAGVIRLNLIQLAIITRGCLIMRIGRCFKVQSQLPLWMTLGVTCPLLLSLYISSSLPHSCLCVVYGSDLLCRVSHTPLCTISSTDKTNSTRSQRI